MNNRDLRGCITHKEATIRSFMRNPDFAEALLKEVIADGDFKEIHLFKTWFDEARARMDVRMAAAEG